VNRWPTEGTLLGAFFDVTNPRKVGDAGPLRRPGNRSRARVDDIANFGSGQTSSTRVEGTVSVLDSRESAKGFSSASGPGPCHFGGVVPGARPASTSVLTVLPGRRCSFGRGRRCLARNGAAGTTVDPSGPTEVSGEVGETRDVSSPGRTLEGNEAQEGEGAFRSATVGWALRTRRRSKASKPTLRSDEASNTGSGNGGGRRCRAGQEGTARGQRPR
jgi:hypothetical protein